MSDGAADQPPPENLRRSPDVALKGGEEKRGSPPPMQPMPPAPSSLLPPPSSNRPPSVASTHSNASGGPSRSTATSRRGGRTRSRSPPTMVNRSDYPPPGEPPFESGRGSPANPSSVAASAAAAAKALSNSSGGHGGAWYPEGNERQRERRGGNGGGVGGPGPERYHPGYEMFGGSQSWPGEEDGGGDRRGRSSFDRPSSREAESGDNPKYGVRLDQSDRPGDPYHSGRRKHDYGRPPPYEARGGEFDSGRYPDSRRRSGAYDRDGRGRTSSVDPPLRYRRENLDESYKGPGPEANPPFREYSPRQNISRERGSSATVKRSGGTRQVIGTPTPIHVPRAADIPSSSRTPHPSDGTPASVFRDRPGDDLNARRSSPSHGEDSAQKILLSLRTPTTSFEDPQQRDGKPRKSGRPNPALPLSPEGPPQIQHAHHQHQVDQTLFFEPQRESPKQGSSTAPSGTIEMAPSFSLFNQSFDSLGDTAQYLSVSGPLDGAFSSISFGAGPTGSHDNDNPQPLPQASTPFAGSGGERNHSLLGSASGGMMTFGMSPVNSFGNGATNSSSSRRSGNSSMMVLGGPDQQGTSPTQMLSMYPSYSGGFGSQGSVGPPFRSRSGQAGENTMRSMSSGSFGGQSAYNKSFGVDGSPHPNYHGHISHEGSRSHDGTPTFYAFLSRHKGAFIKCSFLLPGLKAALLESPPISDSKKPGDDGDNKRKMSSRRGNFIDPSPQDIAIAMRRVASAICAFGGSISGDRRSPPSDKSKDGSAQSIFREKEDENKVATVTPSSSSGTPPGNRSHPKMKYDEVLPSRYYENENRLSWEFEESPPVENIEEDETKSESSPNKDNKDIKVKQESDDSSRSLSSPAPNQKPNAVTSDSGAKSKTGSPSDQPKMRYRCKLCGLPKQNHTCAYQQSLQRSIGIMVYPAVNAFTASEPGSLAPALSDMNNFVSSGSESHSSAENSPSRPTPDRLRKSTITPGKAPNVTPETMRSATSPDGSIASGSPFRSPTKRKNRSRNVTSPPGSTIGRKRPHSQMNSTSGSHDDDLLFVDTTELRPEQFRSVTIMKKGSQPDAYMYPALPLPYAQRKRLSDNLFSLSKEVPQLTDECAVVLREAREKDMWDLAVAELMTQVVVVIHCRDGDSRFEGLRHYLLTLGIAC